MANGDILAYKPTPAIRLVDRSGMLEEVERGPGLWQRWALDLGIMTMAAPIKPYWNAATAAAWMAVFVGMLTVLGFIAGLYVYTRDTNLKLGDEQGYQRAKREQMQNQLDAIAADEKRRKELEIYNSRQTDEKDGHAIKDEKGKK